MRNRIVYIIALWCIHQMPKRSWPWTVDKSTDMAPVYVWHPKFCPYLGEFLSGRIYALAGMLTGLSLHELDQWVIGLWKYVLVGILACLKNQVENHSQIDNSVNNKKSKTYKSNLSKAWKEKENFYLVCLSWYANGYVYILIGCFNILNDILLKTLCNM